MAIEKYTFIYNGITGNIELNTKIFKFYYKLPSDNVRIFERISFLEEDLLQEYECRFTTYLQNKLGEEIQGTRKLVSYRVSSSEVNIYQETELANVHPGIKYKNFTKKSTINGLVSGLADFGCTTVKAGEFISSDKNGRDGFKPYNAVDFTQNPNP